MVRLFTAFVCLALAALLVVVLAESAPAIPRYAAQYGQKCHLCHQNPTGGGMRTPYASQFLVPTEMSLRKYEPEEWEFFDPQLGKNVMIGMDLRTRYSYSEEKKDESSFFQMQGDLYVNFQLNERFAAYFDSGISGTYELYGIGFVMPSAGYVKVGRFVPPFGWRFADHTAFVRDRMGFAPPSHSDVGFEIGWSPKSLSLQAAMTNGAPGRIRDTDHRMAYFLRGELRHAAGGVNLAVGLSGLWNHESHTRRTAGGPFGYLSWGPVSWLGEWDWDYRKDEEAVTGLITSHQLAYQILRGLSLRADYHFRDPDLDLKSGAESRIGVGADMLAMPFLGLLVFVNDYRVEEGPAMDLKEYTEFELQVRFVY